MVATKAALAGVQERMVSVLPRKKEDVDALSYLRQTVTKRQRGSGCAAAPVHADRLLVQTSVCQLNGHLHHAIGRHLELLHLPNP